MSAASSVAMVWRWPKRFNNIPVGAPPFFYQWTWGNVIPEAVWVDPDEQIAEIFPNTLPVYGMDDM